MRIQSSALELWSSRQSFSIDIQHSQERISRFAASAEMARPAAPAPTKSAPVVAHEATKESAELADPVQSELNEWLKTMEARYRVLVSLLERLTGRRFELLHADEARPGAAAGDSQAAARTPDAPPARSEGDGGGLELVERESFRLRMEHEVVAFQAQGDVRTEDGRSIRFDLSFTLERSFFEMTSISEREVREQLKDPLVISFDGTPASLGGRRFDFDLDADGQAENLAGLSEGQGFLALDRNGDGRVNDGRELFGALSGQGFAELAGLDGDGNGWIDEGDAAFSRLAVWLDAGSGGGRLVGLKALGIGALSLSAAETLFDRKSADQTLLARLRQSGVWLGEDGRAGLLQQLDLAV
ncbi:MAG: hypothetical protein ACOZAQ_09380 [Pseudomonadota bacterium]